MTNLCKSLLLLFYLEQIQGYILSMSVLDIVKIVKINGKKTTISVQLVINLLIWKNLLIATLDAVLKMNLRVCMQVVIAKLSSAKTSV